MKSFQDFADEVDKDRLAQIVFEARDELAPALEAKGYTGYMLEQMLATPLAMIAAETMLEAYHNWLAPQIDSIK